MKHIFFAHSHTLVLCSLGTIEYLGLNHSDCVFLATRQYKMPKNLTDIQVIDANDAYNKYEKYHYGSFFENRKALKEYDENLRKWTNGEDFMCYPPHLWGCFFSMMSLHKRCKNVAFVQEGAYTVKGYFHLKRSMLSKILGWFSSIRHFGNFRVYPCDGWYVDGCLGFTTKIDVYSTNTKFFQYMPHDITNVHIIHWPKYEGVLEPISTKAVIFVFDGYVTNGIVDKDVYFDCCMRIIEENHKKQNYIKFHPAQSLSERELIINKFIEIGVGYTIFPEDIPFEFYISSKKNLTIIGFGSSLLYYAKDAGHNVIAHSTWLLDSEKFRQQVDSGYPVLDL